jgi:hypothetical protein
LITALLKKLSSLVLFDKIDEMGAVHITTLAVFGMLTKHTPRNFEMRPEKYYPYSYIDSLMYSHDKDTLFSLIRKRI